MFIPTKSGSRNPVNRREKREKNKENKKKIHSALCCIFSSSYSFGFFFICVGPTYHLLFHFLVCFSSETNHFVPVSISFIIIKYSLNMYILRDFSKISFSISHYTRRLEIRKIFRLSRNLTKFDRVARFRETNLTTQSVRHPRSKEFSMLP